MEVKKAKSVRFDNLVKDLGRPEQLILWTAPEQNPPFMKAVHQNRVVTILQPNVGTKKDFGVVGFLKKRNVAFLTFPKPIPYSSGSKVVGIKYQHIAESQPKGDVYKPSRNGKPGIPLREKLARTSGLKPAHREKKLKPEPKHFQATAVLTARQTVDLKAEASTATEAKRLLREKMEEQKMDLDRSELSRTLGKISVSRSKRV